MSQDVLFLLVVAISGIYTSRAMLRLGPPTSELPFKTLLATLLSTVIVVAAFVPFPLPASLVLFTLIFAPLYIFGPLALIGLARARRYTLASGLARVLYWVPDGRDAMNRVLAQVALQHGDADRALELLPSVPESKLLRVQAYALQGRWQELLSLDVPDTGDNTFLAMAARANAHLELGNIQLAEFELEAMERRWQQGPQGPLGYRSITLTKARIGAAKGNFDAARANLQEPLPGVPPYIIIGILAQAAENSGRTEPALQLYGQAYALAPKSQRDKFANKLEQFGRPLPQVVEERIGWNVATIALTFAITGAYALQVWIDQQYGPVAFGLSRLLASSGVAAFLHNLPNVPDADAFWRYLSYAFVHGNLVHIGFNAWVLLDVGRLYEARRHWGNLLATFVAGSVMGAYFVTVAQAGETVVLVGASAGVLGVVGALLADAWRSTLPNDRVLTRMLVQWIAIIMLFSLLPGVSLWAHVGGLVGGLLWGFVRQGLPKTRVVDMVAGGSSILLIGYALLMAAQWASRYL
jgi:rhomboid protease GluP